MNNLTLSPLNHTWILDLDGTIVKHNGYKIDGVDTILPNAKEFLDNISEEDFIVFLTSRTEEYREITEKFLAENNIRYNSIVFNAPYGERILINDRKPSGLDTAVAINIKRDEFPQLQIETDETL
jgi:23S rRNA G2445 N2-methylase RlmL